MSRRVRDWIVLPVAIVVVIACSAIAHAGIIAEWTFDGADNAFLEDSSHRGNDLSNYDVVQSNETSTGTGKSAYFNGSSGGLWTTSMLDLTPYRHIRVSWSQLVQTDAGGVIFEHSPNGATYAGGFCATVNESLAGTECVTISNGDYNVTGSVNAATLTNSHGAANTAWETQQWDINLDASSNDSVLKVYRNGQLVSTYEDYPYAPGLDNKGPAPGSFGNFYFNIGTRQGGSVFLKGCIDNITIESVPEPSTVLLLASGLLGLMAYAWRKRK